jgi:putative ABC transport system substrate-binding protein
MHHVGVLGVPEAWPFMAAFRQGMQDRGYSDGHNIRFTYRVSVATPDTYPALAAELVRLKVDVIVTANAEATRAAKAATATIPIVFLAGDPVAEGLVLSFAYPGGNLTGLSVAGEGMTAKQLELLKEMVPRATRVAILAEAFAARNHISLSESQAAADRLGLRLQILEARNAEEIDRAFAAAGTARVHAMHVYGEPLAFDNRARIVALAESRRLPAMYVTRDFVEAGGLMSFGPNSLDTWRRVAGHVDKILKGVRPTDLPVEQPLKYDLAINMRTARELGLTVPPSLLLRADKILKADQVRVLSTWSMLSVLNELGPRFERETGHQLAIQYERVGVLKRRIEGGAGGLTLPY